MLAKCLLSISPRRQHRVGDAEVCYVVVDNSDKPSGAVHKAVDKILPAGSRYVVCPKPGLANARNAAIAHALAMDASWIAFIDDDEEAADDWLFSLYWSARRYNADACHGVVRYRFPSDAPAWRRRNPWGDWADHDGAELSSAGTGNVIFRADIVRRARLSFCPSLNGMGGEDGKFFRTYHDLGGKIVFSSAPRVVENVPWSRITVRGFARKSHRNGALKVENARIGGHYRARRFVRKAISRALTGVGRTMLAPFAALAGKGLAVLSSGVNDLAESAGIVRGMLGMFPNYYATTDGH
jgi:succinoglycan biosynthesis protein ExoM